MRGVCFDFSRSDASSSFRSSLSVVTSSCSRAFSTTTASWPASDGQQRALVLAQCAPLTRIDGEDADRLVADDEAERQHAADPRLLDVRAHRREPLVVRRVDLGDHARLARLQRRRQEGVRDRLMRTVDPAARRDGELLAFGQVDRDTVGAEQARDALDRRLERVCQRELRDRLADDGEQRPGALELEPGVAWPSPKNGARGRRGRRSSRAARRRARPGRGLAETAPGARRARAARAAASRSGWERVRRRRPCWAPQRPRSLQRSASRRPRSGRRRRRPRAPRHGGARRAPRRRPTRPRQGVRPAQEPRRRQQPQRAHRPRPRGCHRSAE